MPYSLLKFILLIFCCCTSVGIRCQYTLFNISIEELGDSMQIQYSRSINEGDLIKTDLVYSNEMDFHQDLRLHIESLPKNEQNILIYIHGYLGNTPSFAQKSNFILARDIYFNEKSSYKTIINLQWEASIYYPDNYELIPKYAEVLTNPLKRIVDIHVKPSNRSLTYLLHSMGHQVFYQLQSNLENEGLDHPVTNVISFAGDIETDIFEKIKCYKAFDTTKFHIFYHQNDKTLKLANLAVPYQRIGIYGPENINDQYSLYDMSDLSDFETIPGSLSLHRYFYDSPTTRLLLINILSKL